MIVAIMQCPRRASLAALGCPCLERKSFLQQLLLLLLVHLNQAPHKYHHTSLFHVLI